MTVSWVSQKELIFAKLTEGATQMLNNEVSLRILHWHEGKILLVALFEILP